MLKQEIHTLGSRYLDHSLMYPGRYVFTWLKAPCLPWVLVSIEPIVGQGAQQ